MLTSLLNLVRNYIGTVNIAVDCSGESIVEAPDGALLASSRIAYATVIQSVISALKDRTGVVIFFNDKIEHVAPINQLLEFGVYRMLGTIPPGDANLAPVMGFLSVAHPRDLLVVVTDGFVDITAEPHFPVAWALTGTPQYKEPFYMDGDVRKHYGKYFHIGGDPVGLIGEEEPIHG